MGAQSSLTGGLNRPVASTGQWPAHYRQVALPPDTLPPTAQATRMPPARAQGGSRLGLFSDCDHLGFGSGLVRAVCARLMPAEQRA
jgi:hypothetical protein